MHRSPPGQFVGARSEAAGAPPVAEEEEDLAVEAPATGANWLVISRLMAHFRANWRLEPWQEKILKLPSSPLPPPIFGGVLTSPTWEDRGHTCLLSSWSQGQKVMASTQNH